MLVTFFCKVVRVLCEGRCGLEFENDTQIASGLYGSEFQLVQDDRTGSISMSMTMTENGEVQSIPHSGLEVTVTVQAGMGELDDDILGSRLNLIETRHCYWLPGLLEVVNQGPLCSVWNVPRKLASDTPRKTTSLAV